MKVQITKQIRTQIISNLQSDDFQNKIAIITRKQADKTSKWEYSLELYRSTDLQLIDQLYLYSTYDIQKHHLAIGYKHIAVGIRNFVLIIDKGSLKIIKKLQHGITKINSIAYSQNERFLGVVGSNIYMVGSNIYMWDTSDYRSVRIKAASIYSTWNFIEFTKITNTLIIASLNRIFQYRFNSTIDSFQSVNSTDENNTIMISSMQPSPINDDELLIGRLQSDPEYFSLSQNFFFKKNSGSQPFLKNNIKVADYFPDGKGFVSGDLKGLAVWNADGSVSYFQNEIIGPVKMSNNGLFLYNFLWEALRIVEIQIQCSAGVFRSECTCPSNQIWSISSFSCVPLKCSETTEIGSCVCQKGYSFDPIVRQCLLTCSKKTNAFRNTKLANYCSCFHPYVWDPQRQACIFSCSIFAYAAPTQSSQTDHNCECAFGLIWIKDKNRCLCDDEIYEQLDQEKKLCGCIQGFYRKQNSTECQANCPLRQYGNSPDPQQCQCPAQSSFIINNSLFGCQKDCGKIKHAVSDYLTYSEACLCEEHYIWDGQGCTINCLEATQIAEVQSPGACKCPILYFWNSDIGECVKNCSEQSFALESGSTNKKCDCIERFTWNSNLQICEIDCPIIEDATQFKVNSEECECRQGFSWNKTDHYCEVNCSDIDGAYRKISETQCKCRGGKQYDPDKAICVDRNSGLILGDIWITFGVIAGAIILLVILLSCIRFCINKRREKKKEKEDKRQKKESEKKDYVWNFRPQNRNYQAQSDERMSTKQYRPYF